MPNLTTIPQAEAFAALFRGWSTARARLARAREAAHG